MSRCTRWLGLLLVLGACKTDQFAPLKVYDAPPDSGFAEDPLAERPVLAHPLRFYRRASLDITGHLPEPDELDAIAANPASLDARLADLLTHPGLEERLVHMLDEQWHLRYEGTPVGPSDYGFDPSLRYTLARHTAEEPLRLMARVVAEDRSWNDIVQTDRTMATPLLTRIWPLEPVDPDDEDWGEGDWAEARWTDYRPAVGVLASNGLWWRYNTTAFNYNRTRGAALARLLLCTDYLAIEVEFESPSLTDVDGTEEAIRTNTSCTACHASLDPLSSLLFGFWAYDLYDPLEISRYHPEREPLGTELLGIEPEWFGTPIHSLADLATVVPADARFPRCAVETFAQGMWRRPFTDTDTAMKEALLTDFEAHDRRVGALLLALTRTPAYVGDLAQEPSPDSRPRLLGPQQLSAVLKQTLDFDWTYRGENQLDNDLTGLRVALGGVDGEEVTGPKHQPDASLALAWRAVAEAAGRHALLQLDDSSCALLPGATTSTTPDDTAFEPAVSHAWRWLTATEPTTAELQALEDLFFQAAARDTREGWAALIAALLQDPLLVTY
jgi:hypothetical protein